MDRGPDIRSTEAVRALIDAALADPDATWSLGGFGALAEFGRTADEPARRFEAGRTGLETARGGIALAAGAAVPIAYETAFTGGWSHAVALCLPRAACPFPGAGVVTETGADHGAIRVENSGDNLFDLGLDLPQGRVGLRTGDPVLLAGLRDRLGRPAFEGGSPILDLIASRAVDLVVTTPLGRVEVFAGSQASPPAPRGFVLPRLLTLRRTHAATAPIPPGLVPVATLHPAHPCRDAARNPRPFDAERHAAFQAILARWGDPDLVALKTRLAAGEPLDARAATRRTRGVARVVREQADAKSRNDTPR
ncbi:DUF6925 family protein [Methylobacterium sp. J-068]|uniref:DUF6925 family protein n=1 Tax=Methylobacterium sp. J-068 TaxID=2836649 RepID=UPI001FBBBAB7|nr:hypothetical protein [Methylobacterium sp. J-068]MCJ2034414.1 hypothetical protein [Methylobacterium sp. J-068]